ncbi:MAG: phospholipase D-like domain-containing protein [Nocardioides sp.]
MRSIVMFVVIGALLVPTGGSTATAGTPDNFRPKAGANFNNPTGDRDARRGIYRRIIRSVDSAPKGSTIKFFTWNFLTSQGTDVLLRAQRRGVTVRLIMDASNNRDEVGNPPFRRLRSGLHQGNKAKPKRPNSWAKTCQNSCRGPGGAAHAKFFMFSEVGKKAKKVVMQGSANFTLASTNNQWNDTVTHVNHKGVWKFYNKVFGQAAKDKKRKSPLAKETFKGFTLYMFPLGGRERQDPVMKLLKQVKCRGAKNTASHRTVIRIAPDVIRNPRGMALARKVRGLWNAGCDIRIGYTVLGIDVGRYLRSSDGRGPVPMKHLVQDFDGDGRFDNYFHLKAMTVVGHVGNDRSDHVVLNGSANWSGLGKVSDENIGVYRRKQLTLRYQNHLNYWYNNFPSDRSRSARSSTAAQRAAAQEGELVFGSGPNAVYEDGTPYSLTGVDPYANLDVLD